MEKFKKGDLVEPNGKWEYWWNEFKPWPKRFIGIGGFYGDNGHGAIIEESNGSPFTIELMMSGLKLNKEGKVLKILKNYVAFKKKASDNKGRNQGKKANGKPKVSKNSKTT